eukprot:7160438-Prymnesium_polylepis.1
MYADVAQGTSAVNVKDLSGFGVRSGGLPTAEEILPQALKNRSKLKRFEEEARCASQSVRLHCHRGYEVLSSS